MTRFASREMSFVAFGGLTDGAAPQDGTQNCAEAAGVTACTCCTNNTNVGSSKSNFKLDLAALRDQLRAALD